MKASVPGTNVGLNDVNYSPIKVGDTLRDPDTHGTLTVDRFGKILDVAGKEKPAKDYYYRILSDPRITKPKAKREKDPQPAPAPQPEPEEVKAPEVKAPEVEVPEAPEIEPEEITPEEPGKEAVNPLAGFPDRDLANELRRRGYQVAAIRYAIIDEIL